MAIPLVVPTRRGALGMHHRSCGQTGIHTYNINNNKCTFAAGRDPATAREATRRALCMHAARANALHARLPPSGSPCSPLAALAARVVTPVSTQRGHPVRREAGGRAYEARVRASEAAAHLRRSRQTRLRAALEWGLLGGVAPFANTSCWLLQE